MLIELRQLASDSTVAVGTEWSWCGLCSLVTPFDQVDFQEALLEFDAVVTLEASSFLD